MIKLVGLSDKQVKEISRRIADAFFDYEYNKEDIGLIKYITTRDDMFTYMNAIVRAAYKSGVLYTTSDRQEGYLMLSGEGAGGSIGFLDGMKMIAAEKKALGGIFFYPKVMQERVIEIGLMTEQELKRRRTFAYVLLLALMIIVPGFMILRVNGAQTYFSCCWQFYVLFLGAEFFDWLVIDTIWVALSDWWIIPGTEDLNDTWHSIHVKQWKMLKLIPVAIPVSAVIGALYWGIKVLAI